MLFCTTCRPDVGFKTWNILIFEFHFNFHGRLLYFLNWNYSPGKAVLFLKIVNKSIIDFRISAMFLRLSVLEFATHPASIQYHSFRLRCVNFKTWQNSEITSSQLQSQNYCSSWQKSVFKSFILLYYDSNVQNNTTFTCWCPFTKCKCITFFNHWYLFCRLF